MENLAGAGGINGVSEAGTPREVIARLSAEVAKAVRQSDVVQRFGQLGIDAVGSSPEAYAAINRADYEKYARVVKLSGAKID